MAKNLEALSSQLSALSFQLRANLSGRYVFIQHSKLRMDCRVVALLAMTGSGERGKLNTLVARCIFSAHHLVAPAMLGGIQSIVRLA